MNISDYKLTLYEEQTHAHHLFVCLWLYWVSVAAEVFSSCNKRVPLCRHNAQAAHCDASVLVEHGLQVRGLQSLGHMGSVAVAPGLAHWLKSYGAWVQLLCGMRDPLKSEIEPMSSAGRFFTTEPPGKHFPIFFF